MVKTNEFRKKMADIFIKSLEEKQFEWKKEWAAMETPYNVVSGRKYRGINKFVLYLQAQERLQDGEIPDPRWATFKQIQDAGWKVKKGAKGCVVELWKPYDPELKREISWKEYNEDHLHKNYTIIARNYYVFNGRDIEGLPELQPHAPKEIISDEIIDKIQKGMNLQILNDGGSRAYYSPATDSIHLPEKNSFYNSYAYNATALHELSHATGAEKRLNRELKNAFGTEKYAYEELVAEISSSFMSEHLQIEQTEEHINNHKAYIQSWSEMLSERPETLMKAIRDAEKAANYLEYHAEILSKEEYENTLTLHEDDEAAKNVEKSEPQPQRQIIQRNKEKMIEHFQELAHKYAVQAHRENNLMAKGKAEAYQLVAFDIEHNLAVETIENGDRTYRSKADEAKYFNMLSSEFSVDSGNLFYKGKAEAYTEAADEIEKGLTYPESMTELEKQLETAMGEKNIDKFKEVLKNIKFIPDDPVFDSQNNVVINQSARAVIGNYEVVVGYNNQYTPHMVNTPEQAIQQKIVATIYIDNSPKKYVLLYSEKTRNLNTAKLHQETMEAKWKKLTDQEQIKIPRTREADLKANGYKLTPALKKHMDRLDQLTGRRNSVKDIYKMYKEQDYHGSPEMEKTVKSIGKIFQRQEMQLKSNIPQR